MSYRFVFLLTALCFISCQGSKQKPVVQEETGISSVLPGQDVLTVDLDSIAYEKQMPLSAFFKDVRYIPLETTRESLLGRINQLCMQGDTIFVLDGVMARSVLMFRKDGSYIGMVGSRGEGPSEYVAPTDCGIAGDQFYIFDSRKQCILYYGLPDMKFSHAVTLKQQQNARSRYIGIDGNRIYADVYFPGTSPSYLVQELDSAATQVVNKWISKDAYNRGYHSDTYFTGESFFSKTSVGIRFNHLASDSVLAIGKNGIYPYLSFSYQDRPTSAAVKEHAERSGEKDILKSLTRLGGVHNIQHYTEGERFILFFFSRGNYLNHFIYDKKTQECRVGIFLHDKVSPKLMDQSVVPIPVWEDDENVYFYIHPMEVSRFVGMLKSGEIACQPDDKAALSRLDEETNPVLICYRK